ncbi:MAG TPA: methionine aminotransferase [Flavobacteriales bacterium]|nr:methionine aminotransferase [Flavobacteriales bacterium]|tara:strand:+ start:90990 stop:92147 length:1158 start_codon:yes stop_codon:yes gene_type:complete
MPVFPGIVKSKLPHTGTTIFTVMSALAKEHQAINLSQGFPDFPIDTQLADLVKKAIKKGFNQYAPMPGLPQLRETIANKIATTYGVNYNPKTEITITAGATQAIFTAIAATINEGDEVVIFTPAYDCYEPAITLNGGKPIYFQLSAPDYKVDWEKVKRIINQRTKMIIINTPHNPTGSILTKDDMQTLERMLSGTDILVLSDEVYEHIIFDNEPHESAVKFKGLAERAIVVSSFGKTFHVTGWKIGYCVAPENIMKEFRKAHQFNVFSVNTPMQWAINEYLQNPEHYNHLSAFYQEKRDFFRSLLKGSKFDILPCKGTYFQLLGYSKISEAKDIEFAKELTIKHKVASIPVSVFYHQNHDDKVLRFCFAKENDTLEKAAEILHSL